jgi:hypothetical protein
LPAAAPAEAAGLVPARSEIERQSGHETLVLPISAHGNQPSMTTEDNTLSVDIADTAPSPSAATTADRLVSIANHVRWMKLE